MRKKELLLSMVLLLSGFCSNIIIYAQTENTSDDYTMLLKNPGFEDNFRCWEVYLNGKGMLVGTGWILEYDVGNGGYINFSNDVITINPLEESGFLDCWALYLNSFDMYQVVKGMPKGMYQVKAALRNTNTIDMLTDQHVYAEVDGVVYNSSVLSDVGVGSDVSNWETLTTSTFVVASDSSEVRLGIRSTGNGTSAAGWFQADKFQLIRLGDINFEPVFTVDGVIYTVNGDGKTCYVSGCSTSLADAIIPSTVMEGYGNSFFVTSIGEGAFGDCSSLISIELPSSVTSIEDYAFYGCTGLMSVRSLATTPPVIGSSTFENVDKSACVLYVPEGCTGSYATAYGWSEFANIFEIGSSAGINEEEWEILMAVREELIDKGWNSPWDISLGISGAGTFKGLKIVQGNVVGVDLSNSNLIGDFPWSILDLPYLEELNLSGNNLSGDIGTGMMSVIHKNPDATANLKIVNLSNNKFSGNISLFANNCPVLQNFDASNNCISDVIPAISSTVTTLDLSRQTIDKVFSLDLTDMTLGTVLSTLPTVLVYDHNAQSYKDNLKLLCTTSELSDFDMNDSEKWGIVLSYANGQLSVPYVSEQNAYYGESGDSLNVMLLNDDYTQEGTTLKMSLKFAVGDANFNGDVDVADLQAIILRIFDKYNEQPFNHTAANIVKDDVLNVQDVVGEVNLLMSESFMATAPEYDKTYYIRPANDATKALGSDSDGWAVIMDKQDNPALQWRTAQGWNTDTYIFLNVSSGLVLDLSVNNRRKPLLYWYSPTYYNANQEFFLRNAGGNSYYIWVNANESNYYPEIKTIYYLKTNDMETASITSDLSDASLFTFEEVKPVVSVSRLKRSGDAQRNTVYCENGELKIYSQEPVAAFDIRISNTVALSVAGMLERLGMVCSVKETVNGTRIIGYSLSGGTLPAGETIVATFEGNNAFVSSATLVDEKADNILSSLNTEPTTISQVSATSADARIVNGTLIVNNNGMDGNVEWSVIALDGRILDKGVIASHNVGNHVVRTNVQGIVIVTLKSDHVKLTKKLINNR